MAAPKRVLDIGAGPAATSKLGRVFHGWQTVRLDIDPRVKPDIVASVTDLRRVVRDATFDAIWSSHTVEHLHTHEVGPTLREFYRILRQDGFALITCPDLQLIAEVIVKGNLDAPVYMSPAGPISALDMLFGHGASIAHGNHYMAHHTGFTRRLMASALITAGFHEVWTYPGKSYDLWAVGIMPTCDRNSLREMLVPLGLGDATVPTGVGTQRAQGRRP